MLAPYLSIVLTCVTNAIVDRPPGSYDAVDATNATTLRATLHPVIDDHTRFPYTSTATDTWNILEAADEDPNNPANILDVYMNASYVKVGAATWPERYSTSISATRAGRTA